MNISMRRAVMMAVIAISVFMGIWGHADACKVLVVSSYHESFFDTHLVKASIAEVLGAECAVTYWFLEGLTDPSGVEAKGQEAYPSIPGYTAGWRNRHWGRGPVGFRGAVFTGEGGDASDV
jgi:hypothetical protein